MGYPRELSQIRPEPIALSFLGLAKAGPSCTKSLALESLGSRQYWKTYWIPII